MKERKLFYRKIFEIVCIMMILDWLVEEFIRYVKYENVYF